MSSIGETLRRERLKRNLDLDQISKELKIPSRFLGAIEDERFETLPAGVFARNFVRQYADLLGLDGESMAAEVGRSLAPEPEPGIEAPAWEKSEIHLPPMESWESVRDRRNVNSIVPALALVVLVMLICSGVYAFWQRARHQVPPPAVAAAPVHTVAAAHAPQPPAAQPAPAPNPAAPPSAAEVAKNEPAKNDVNSADRPIPDSRADAAANPPAAGNPPAAAPGPVHVELKAQEPVWVLVRGDGKYLFSGTIEANQSRSFDATGAVTLRLGNAGGLNISLNGKPIGPVGPKGQIREVQLTSGGFQILAPKPSSDDAPPGDPF